MKTFGSRSKGYFHSYAPILMFAFCRHLARLCQSVLGSWKRSILLFSAFLIVSSFAEVRNEAVLEAVRLVA